MNQTQPAPSTTKPCTIIRDANTYPEEIIRLQCTTCGSHNCLNHPTNPTCRTCGGNAYRRTWTRPDIAAQRQRQLDAHYAAIRQDNKHTARETFNRQHGQSLWTDYPAWATYRPRQPINLTIHIHTEPAHHQHKHNTDSRTRQYPRPLPARERNGQGQKP